MKLTYADLLEIAQKDKAPARLLSTIAEVWIKGSASDENEFHVIIRAELDGKSSWLCVPCDGWRYADHCYHITEVRNEWEKNQSSK